MDQSSPKYYGGRRVENTFYLNDTGVSRIHFTIYFEGNSWWIVDGDGDKRSTSGTWNYVQEPFEISDSMSMKIGESTFQFTIKKNE